MVKITLKDPYKTIVINLSHKSGCRLISSNVTNTNANSNMEKYLINMVFSLIWCKDSIIMHNITTQRYKLLRESCKNHNIYNKYMKSCQENINPKHTNILNMHTWK